ncbi:MAG: hypothetical protein HRT72_00160, partial [Flavobacteriales bacterium]|nr:hypothetical protein [Flavobacteriales bacterium]
MYKAFVTRHRQLLLLVLFGFSTALLFQSSSSGPAEDKSIDRTGGPISNADCSGCHTGGSFGSTLSITMKDGQGASVTSYLAGETYTLEAVVSGASGGAYGFQGVVLNANDDQAGDFTGTGSASQLVTLSGVEYVEHNAPAVSTNNSFTFEATWVAPVLGTGDVTVYATGMIVNDNGGTSGDEATTPGSLTITENNPTATIEGLNGALVKIYPNPAQDYISLSEINSSRITGSINNI